MKTNTNQSALCSNPFDTRNDCRCHDCRYRHRPVLFCLLALAVLSLLVLAPMPLEAANTVTFDNQSGRPALVKVVGPTTTSVEVQTGKKETVEAAAGHYLIKVRYGTPGSYSYSKGDEFDVTETPTSFSKISITLHKVVGGNYGSKQISEQEFGEEEKTKTNPASKSRWQGNIAERRAAIMKTGKAKPRDRDTIEAIIQAMSLTTGGC